MKIAILPLNSYSLARVSLVSVGLLSVSVSKARGALTSRNTPLPVPFLFCFCFGRLLQGMPGGALESWAQADV